MEMRGSLELKIELLCREKGWRSYGRAIALTNFALQIPGHANARKKAKQNFVCVALELCFVGPSVPIEA
jgi:hypothetical protein